MDSSLIARWREGDSAATTAVRNALRTTAERVVGSPALGLSDAPALRLLARDDNRRRELTAQIAKEAMDRGATSPEQLTAMAILVSARRVVELAREGRPHPPGAHLPPPVAVAMALAPNTLPEQVRAASQAHLDGCGVCTEECRLARTAVQEQRDLEAETLAETMAQDESGQASDAELLAAMNAAADEESGDRPRPSAGPARGAAARTRPPPRPKGGQRSARKGPKEESKGISFRTIVPILLILGAGVWYWKSNQKANPADATAYAVLADRSPPPASLVGADAALAGDAMRDLERKDCRTAAARLRTARRREPGASRLWLAEGAAFVCAGDGAAAIAALEPLSKAISGHPAETSWYLAQAWLLRGDPAKAMDALDLVVSEEPARATKARELRSRISEVR